jgi:hypothetical protein
MECRMNVILPDPYPGSYWVSTDQLRLSKVMGWGVLLKFYNFNQLSDSGATWNIQ